ncbi:MAG: DNA repair protein RecO [Flavobacteriaceae bacterium]|nr:DNA repair protein RecO [Flavobacteriaceae bacterium]
MVVSTKAIVISSLKYAESDLIVTCYTEVAGLKTYILRRIASSKKGKLRVAQFQPLTQLDLIAFHKNKGALEQIREAKVVHPYKTLHTNIIKSSLTLFISEVLKNAIHEESNDLFLYKYLTDSLNWLDNNDDIANFYILFLLNLTTHLGFYPDHSTIEHSYFNMLEGNFQIRETNKYCKKGNLIDYFKLFFGINFDSLSQIKMQKQERLELLNLLLDYYQLHLHGFKKPKSILILNQLFR